MKKLIVFLNLILFCTLSANSQVEIPNGDFEKNTGNYIDNWDLKSGDCQVREFITLSGSNGSMTVEPASGNRFITLMNGGSSVGKLETNFPLNTRPEYFSFYCGYIPGTSIGEKFGFFLIFTKYNSTKGMNDTILSVGGYLPASGQIIPWARVSGSLSSYYQTSEIPDMAQIVFMTDVAINSVGDLIASPFTVLALDNVQFPASISTGDEITISNVEQIRTYPNPFKTSTKIDYQLSNNSHVSIKIFDISGKLITTLIDEDQKRGNHMAFFTPVNIPEGVYIFRIETNLGVKSGKLILK
ncbi:MAG: T9SS type A sorting domain-containing protein [Bacteroidetes bacterium]|nr:T9SS type A sorting domain-containing protein [Bacteroidota bacterium]